jgi:hypothetical protein
MAQRIRPKLNPNLTMPQIQIIRKGYLPLGKVHIQIDNNLDFLLKGGQHETTDLPEGEHIITIQMQGTTTTQTIKIDSNSNAIMIKHAMPIFVFAFAIIPICRLIWIDDKRLALASGVFMLLYLSVMLYFQLAPNKLFKCTVTPHE